MPEPILNLDTLVVRPTVEIDGKSYEILSVEELSVLDSRRFSLWAGRLDELQSSEEDNPELDELVDTITRKVLVGVPDDVFAKLSGTHKVAVVEVFTGLLLRNRMSVAGAIQTATGSPLIGALFSLASNVSTAAPPERGWKTLLSRWFGRTPG